MSTTQPLNARLRTLVRVWVDALTYALVLTVVSVAVALTLGITTGGEFVRGKHLLFVFGWGMMAYATAKLWVKSGKQLRAPARQSQQEESTGDGDSDDGPPDPMATASSLRNRVTNDSTQRNTYGESLREKQDATQFQAFVQAVPPNRWVAPPRPEHRMGLAGKLLLTSIFVLGVSFVMETVFGVV